MEPESGLFTLFGTDLETVVSLSAMVYLAIEWIKGRFNGYINSWKTEVVLGALCVLLSYKVAAPNWETVIFLSAVTYIVPGGVHNWLKNRKPGCNGVTVINNGTNGTTTNGNSK